MVEQIVFWAMQFYMIVCKNEHIGEFGNMSWGVIISPMLVVLLIGLLMQVMPKRK